MRLTDALHSDTEADGNHGAPTRCARPRTASARGARQQPGRRDPDSMPRISTCRISRQPEPDLGSQSGRTTADGDLPAHAGRADHAGPLELVWCPDSGLLQLRHSYEPHEMYGENYGYRSGLNQSMVRHLTARRQPRQRCGLRPATGPRHRQQRRDAAEGLPDAGLRRIGIDPTGTKFAAYYSDGLDAHSGFLSAPRRAGPSGDAKAAHRHVDRDVLRPGRSVAFVRTIAAILRRRHLALRAELHAVDAAHELLRHDLPRAPGVLLAASREIRHRPRRT